jgi:hypothetical protein
MHNKTRGKYANKRIGCRRTDVWLTSQWGSVVWFHWKTKAARKNPQDQIFNVHSHTVIRLPPYMCDLNPIELAWVKLKNLIRVNNVSGDVCQETSRISVGSYFTNI